MTALGLRLQKSLYGADALRAEGGVVATVQSVGGTRGASPASRRLTVTIPVGFDTPAAVVDVPLGRYLVEAFLPSGDVVSQEVDVQGPVEVSLEGEHSPHEWLSYQHLLGNVSSGPTYAGRAMSVEPEPLVLSVDHPVPPLDAPGNADVWGRLREVTASPASEAASRLASSPVPLTTPLHDDRVQLFQLTSRGYPPSQHRPGPDEGRRYLLVQDGPGRTLVSLPFPWNDVLTYEPCVAEVLVRRRDASDGPPVTISIRDGLVGTVLGYLTSGAFTTAREIVGPAQQLLLGKVQNPLAAAAGGYVLTACSSESEASWHRWLDNLTEWFPWLPDGPVIRARLLLQLARDDNDIDVARQSLRMAFDRGLPYFGLGLQWLVEGLTVFAEKDREAAEMLEGVRPVARRCNLQQPFTVLDLSSR